MLRRTLIPSALILALSLGASTAAQACTNTATFQGSVTISPHVTGRFKGVSPCVTVTIPNIIDAHTGFIEGRGLGTRVLALAKTGLRKHAAFVVSPATGAVAQMALRGAALPSALRPHVVIRGRVLDHGKPARYWRVLVGTTNLREGPLGRGRTLRNGTFAIPLRLRETGAVRVAAEHGGKLCGAQSVAVPTRYSVVGVTIRCRT
jgi:hypothetical protein